MERVWTYFLDTSKSREWFSLGMEGFSLGGTKELRRVTQGTSMIPIVFHALRKKKKKLEANLVKIITTEQVANRCVLFCSLHCSSEISHYRRERDEMSVFDTRKGATQKVGGSGRVDSGDQSRRGGNVRV